MLDSVELEITGIVNSADPMVNHSALFINLSEAKALLGVDGVTEVTLRLDHPRFIQKIPGSHQKLVSEFGRKNLGRAGRLSNPISKSGCFVWPVFWFSLPS